MAAAVVGTAVGLYTVVNQDTNHGAEHHPLGDPHGEGGAQKTGTGSTVGEENKQDEPEEETKDESKEESKDESKEEPKSDQQNPSKPTTSKGVCGCCVRNKELLNFTVMLYVLGPSEAVAP